MVQGNPRIFKALKTELATVLTELKRIEAGNGVDEELLNVIELIAVIMAPCHPVSAITGRWHTSTRHPPSEN